MEQQVKSEIDQLFQELIVAKISKSIENVNASMVSLLGEDSEIQFKLKQLPTNGGVKSIMSTQLEGLNEQASTIVSKLDAEKKKLAAVEKQVGLWIIQSSDASKAENEKIYTFLTDTFSEEGNEESFRLVFKSEIKKTIDSIDNCQKQILQIQTGLDELMKAMQNGNTCSAAIKEKLSVLEKNSESFAQKSEIVQLQNSIEESRKIIEGISNKDVLDVLQQYQDEVKFKFDNLRKEHLLLLLMNVATIIIMFLIFMVK